MVRRSPQRDFLRDRCRCPSNGPNFIPRLDDSWGDDDFEEIQTNVGPFIGNWIRRHGFEWHDYEYYTLYEAFEKIAQVFQERERYQALKSVHDEFIAEIRAELPPRSERPEIGLMSVNDDFEQGVFSLYQVTAGNGKKQYQDLGINDAFADLAPSDRNDADYELLFELDPDILVFHFAASHATPEVVEEKREILRNSDFGSQLSAVQNDRMYPGGTAYQGQSSTSSRRKWPRNNFTRMSSANGTATRLWPTRVTGCSTTGAWRTSSTATSN